MNLTPSDLRCPLCGGSRTASLDRLSGSDLNRAWLRSYGITADIGTAQIDYRRCDDCSLQFFTPPEDGDAGLYEALQKQDWYYLSDKPEYALAQRYVPAEGAVLEVGAGKAAFARLVGERRYLGLEFNDAAIERARSAGISLAKQAIQAHALQHPGLYSAVVSFQVLEHVSDPASFVAACVDALAPGGTLVLAVPDHDGLCGLAQNNILDMPPHHVSHWNERSLRFIAQRHQLELVAIERESITELHKPWARRAVIEQRMRRGVGLSARLLDRRLSARILGKLAAMLALVAAPAIDEVGGHTIVGVFRKP